jgi:spore coat polysaccharide biosynthesis predicted glycosyltransferase SpsG
VHLSGYVNPEILAVQIGNPTGLGTRSLAGIVQPGYIGASFLRRHSMAELRAWIRAQREQGYGTLHLSRALALAEAAMREGIDKLTVVTDDGGADFLRDQLPEGVELTVISGGLTQEQESARLIEMMHDFFPARVDSRTPRPLIYLCGHRYEAEYQRRLWKAGAEVVVIADEAHDTFADWYVIPKPYGGELAVKSISGYTRFLRGAHYAPLSIRSMKAIYQNRDHATFAQHFAIATENLDIDKWLPVIGEAISNVTPPAGTELDFNPTLTILPGVDCPSDEELRQKLGSTANVKVSVAVGRRDVSKELVDAEVLFAADGIVLQEALAIGTVRICLPRRGEESDLMQEHLIRREASPTMPDPISNDFKDRMTELMNRVCFDPAWRRGQFRVGQYLCDGIGSIRIIRQTAFKVYAVPQNMVRYFDVGDPLIPNL